LSEIVVDFPAAKAECDDLIYRPAPDWLRFFMSNRDEGEEGDYSGVDLQALAGGIPEPLISRGERG